MPTCPVQCESSWEENVGKVTREEKRHLDVWSDFHYHCSTNPQDWYWGQLQFCCRYKSEVTLFKCNYVSTDLDKTILHGLCLLFTQPHRLTKMSYGNERGERTAVLPTLAVNIQTPPPIFSHSEITVAAVTLWLWYSLLCDEIYKWRPHEAFTKYLWIF